MPHIILSSCHIILYHVISYHLLCHIIGCAVSCVSYQALDSSRILCKHTAYYNFICPITFILYSLVCASASTSNCPSVCLSIHVIFLSACLICCRYPISLGLNHMSSLPETRLQDIMKHWLDTFSIRSHTYWSCRWQGKGFNMLIFSTGHFGMLRNG